MTMTLKDLRVGDRFKLPEFANDKRLAGECAVVTRAVTWGSYILIEYSSIDGQYHGGFDSCDSDDLIEARCV